MEILGVGPSELIFVIIIAIIVLGPKDMQKAGRTLGRWLNQLTHSDGWKVFQRTSHELRNLPTKLMLEANMDEIDKEVRHNIDPRPKPSVSAKRRNASVEHRESLASSKQANYASQPNSDNTSADEDGAENAPTKNE